VKNQLGKFSVDYMDLNENTLVLTPEPLPSFMRVLGSEFYLSDLES